MANEGRPQRHRADLLRQTPYSRERLMTPIGLYAETVWLRHWVGLAPPIASNTSQQPPRQLQASFQLAHRGLADSTDPAAAVQFGVERRV